MRLPAPLSRVVDRVFPLEDVQGAYRYMEQGEQLGKIVVKVAD
ncbi:MAG: zinc-binding dehydrogenase [Pseudomonadota bacterium]